MCSNLQFVNHENNYSSLCITTKFRGINKLNSQVLTSKQCSWYVYSKYFNNLSLILKIKLPWIIFRNGSFWKHAINGYTCVKLLNDHFTGYAIFSLNCLPHSLKQFCMKKDLDYRAHLRQEVVYLGGETNKIISFASITLQQNER